MSSFLVLLDREGAESDLAFRIRGIEIDGSYEGKRAVIFWILDDLADVPGTAVFLHPFFTPTSTVQSSNANLTTTPGHTGLTPHERQIY